MDMNKYEQLQKENDELKAYIELLRDAAKPLVKNVYTTLDGESVIRHVNDILNFQRALQQTPAQSLERSEKESETSLNHILSKVEEETIERFNILGIWKWLSAALDDENVCAEMKIDITEAFTFLETRKYKEQSNED